MKKLSLIMIVFLILFAACAEEAAEKEAAVEEDILSEVPEGAQALSLRGEPLYASTPYENVQQQYE